MTTKLSKKSEETSKLAVIRTGGRQFLAKEGDIIKIEKLKPETIKDGKLIFEDVLLVSDEKGVEIGTPVLKSKVSAELVSEGRDKKITVIHYKAKSRYFKKNGHRQPFMKVRITKIG